VGEPKEPKEDETPGLAEDPSTTLAAQIAGKLVDEGLISEGDRERLERSLAKGSATADEWRLLFENALERGSNASE
jgi:hypothetical protein